jgi:hypothetical protein
VTELIASGPLRYLGGSIETFALPMGAFIVAALVLFYIYRRPHDVPRLKYLRPAHQVALGTREPGVEGLVYVPPAVVAPPAAAPGAETEAPAETMAEAPAEAEAAAQAPAEAAADSHASSRGPEASADAGHDGTPAEGETF